MEEWLAYFDDDDDIWDISQDANPYLRPIPVKPEPKKCPIIPKINLPDSSDPDDPETKFDVSETIIAHYNEGDVDLSKQEF